jgi:A/G-specific adenine glycosylase
LKNKDQRLVALLLNWFAANARDLPWRRARDPYAIWVSEIMLQQTQVKTVIPYWERWMRELPTIESLARASADKIHKLWEGLGYYTRVRNMQKAAQEIVAYSRSRRREEAHSPLRTQSEPPHVGCYKFPDTFDAVLALPGIGRYTAGAICSIAFNQPTPILDGNVIRVLTRIHGIKTDPREKQTNAHLWQLAEQLVSHAKSFKNATATLWTAAGSKAPRRFGSTNGHSKAVSPLRSATALQNSCSHLNQSLMELGALICTRRSPSCAICPVQKLCVARKENLQEQLPNLGKREAATERRFVAFVVERDGKFLVRQRPAGIVNAHLWEFPNVEVAIKGGRTRHSVRAAKQPVNGAQRTDAPCQPSDFKVTSTKPLRIIKHSITRYRITLEVWTAESKNGKTESGSWLTPRQLHRLAFTSAHKKILTALG